MSQEFPDLVESKLDQIKDEMEASFKSVEHLLEPDPNAKEDFIPLNLQLTPGTLFQSLMKPPVLRFKWHGKDILGNDHSGQGDTTQDCHDGAAKSGAVTCHMEQNPDFTEPEPEMLPDPNAKENNAFYAEGFADGDSAYQDVKALILAWVSDQMLSSNPGMGQDVESLPFVTYVRYNR